MESGHPQFLKVPGHLRAESKGASADVETIGNHRGPSTRALEGLEGLEG